MTGQHGERKEKAQSEKTKREQIFKKTRQALPEEIFMSIKTIILDQRETISKIMSKNKGDGIITCNYYPKLLPFINEGLWDIQEVEQGIMRKLCFSYKKSKNGINFQQ